MQNPAHIQINTPENVKMLEHGLEILALQQRFRSEVIVVNFRENKPAVTIVNPEVTLPAPAQIA